MNQLLQRTLKNASTRILVVIFLCMIGFGIYFVVSSYHSTIDLHEQKELTRLKSISATLSIQIDGQAHQRLYDDFPEKDQIKTNDQVGSYYNIVEILRATQRVNGLSTNIYTMVYEPDEQFFRFAVNAQEPFFRHEYKEFPERLVNQYDTGGFIPVYEDEHGMWLSAFAPIKDDNGKTVAIVQVDEQFDSFIAQARSQVWKGIAMTTGILLVVALIMIRMIRNILSKEQEMIDQLRESKTIIEEKNRDLTDSINYAWMIQQAVLPSLEDIKTCFPSSFVLYRPRDIVSGDFYWHVKTENKSIIVAADSTGHGVPGAFMSMIGSMILNQIVHQEEITNPGKILDRLDAEVKRSFSTTDGTVDANDGFDLAVVSVDHSSQVAEFAGAFRPLLVYRDNAFQQIRGSRCSIGGDPHFVKDNFECHSIQLQAKDRLYLFSDGLADQFGGLKNKKFTLKRFKQVLVDSMDKSMAQQREMLEIAISAWQGELEQIDDILVIGIEL